VAAGKETSASQWSPGRNAAAAIGFDIHLDAMPHGSGNENAARNSPVTIEMEIVLRFWRMLFMIFSRRLSACMGL
jgi:hypothetical protein